MAEIIIPDSVLETFRCSLCRGYLSCAPVQVLGDGNSICSVCSRAADQPTYRELAFEALLSKLSFPCQFQKSGCKERFPFGQANEHEENCSYRSFLCPLMANERCSWEGLGVEIFDHFVQQHLELTKQKAEFKLRLDKNQQRMFLFLFEDVPFIIKCVYHADTSSLQYDIRYFIHNLERALCAIRLTNADDCNCNVSLKGDVCVPYNVNFYSMQYAKILVLNNYMQILDNPSCVKVAINLSLTKSNNKNASLELFTINHDLLQSLRCKRCRGYLIPPLFDSSKGVVCSYCHEKFGNTQILCNDQLKEVAAGAVFPCCWPNCAFIGKAQNLKKHQSSCARRIFKCINCKISFMRNRAMSHLRYHGYKYFTDTVVYKMAFKKHYRRKNLFTFKDDEIVVITQETISSRTQYDRHVLSMHVVGSYSSEVSVTVEFAHSHCQTGSAIFTLTTYNPCYCFMMNDLPLCFKTGEKLKVTLKV